MLVKNKKLIKDKTKYNKNCKHQKGKTVIIILLFLVVLLGIVVGTSISKYQYSIYGKVMSQIAKPIIEIRKEESILVTASSPKASYTFEVRNYKEDEPNKVNINEVDMEYYIEIIGGKNDAIQFELYRGETEIQLTNNKTEKIQLIKGKKDTHLYRLDITYDKTKANSNTSINENVEIKIHSIQKA